MSGSERRALPGVVLAHTDALIDRGVSMSRSKRGLNDCPACMTMEEAVRLTELGGRVREYFTSRGDRYLPAVVITRVLCWWCREYHSPAEVVTCMAMERPRVVQGDGSPSSLTAKMPTWLSQYPELWEFLSRPSYKDGSPRQLGKISFGLNSAGIQMTLTDPSSSTYCSRAYSTIEDALLAFEVGLGDGSLTWRASGPVKARKRP